MPFLRRLTRWLGATAVLVPFAAIATHPSVPQAALPKKLALIVAIGSYDKVKTGYDSISSLRDVALVRGALLAQRFDSTNIRVLLDQAATREGMVEALRRLGESAGPGDAIVVHYSGHGHQISDVNGDEPDGLDEMLVPFGAPNFGHAPADYKGERHLLDDELAPLLDELRRRVGPRGNVAFFLDACFSGSGTRGGGELPVRGVLTPFVIPGAPTREGPGTDRASGIEVGGRGRTRSGDDGLAPFVVISATRFDQLDHETFDEAQQKSVGPLSLALSRALPRIDSLTSYRDLFERITVEMSAMHLGNQDPQLEGNADIRVFNGQAVSRAPYFQVAEVLEDTLLAIKGGMFQGLFPGTTLQFRRAGSGNRSEVIDSGVVRDAFEFDATARVSGKAPREVLRNSRAFVTSYTYGEKRIRVELDASLEPAIRSALEAELATIPIVEVTRNAAELRLAGFSPATRGAGRAGVVTVAIASNDTVGKLSGPTDSLAEALAEQVRTVARSSYFRRLNMTDPERNLAFSLQVLPASGRIRRIGNRTMCPELADTVSLAARQSPGGGGGSVALQMSPDDVYWLRVRNEGKEPAYFSILDLQSDYSIGLLYPPRGNTLSDVVVNPGESYRIPGCYYATRPYGLEILKLIATTERVDFGPMVTPGFAREAVRAGGMSPLEQLFADAFRGTRSDPATPTGHAVTAEVTIRVVPRE